MRSIFLVLFAIILGGCSSAAPNFVNGKYYMMGDKNCARYTSINDGQIMCYDKNGNRTGHRNYMTAQELQGYTLNQQQTQQNFNGLMSSMNQLTNSANSAASQTRQQMQSYTPPQVQPISQPSYSRTIMRQVDANTVIDSNGQTYNRIGNIVYGPNGSKCQIIGQNIFCN